ncbi:STAS domain-containing protein [Crateriforma conspicua]|uniref:Anti-sigma factor antagonist n=1 Tax=Crateriforma conspicua TaxID=2527996 RepID=A0A5C5YCB6_9PLAN|nr:STAS domain-containing protein [Crateriforma conspicua]TWT70962.1 putative anti-sigma factor antagonist BtrV [Crateriforma conspicua]
MIDYRTEVVGKNEDVLVVHLRGRMDSVTSDFLFDVFSSQVESDLNRVVIDCEELDYVSSSGLAALVRLHSRLRKAGGIVKLAAVNSSITDVLRVVHFEKLFGIYDTVDDAVLAF